MSDAKEVSYGFGVKVAVLMLIIVQYTMTMTTQINAQIQAYSLSLGEQFGYLYNQTDAIVYTLALASGLGTALLLRKFTKKQVALMGATAMVLFGFLPFFTGSIGYIGVLIPRALVGLGAGIIMPFTASFAVDLFKGGKESWMLGMRSVVGACAGYFFMNASYVIAVNYYPAIDGVVQFPAGSFLLPLVGVIGIIIMAIKLPKGIVPYAKENISAEEAITKKPASAGLIYANIVVLMIGVATALVYFVYQVVANFGESTPDEGISFMLSAAIAVIFLLFAVMLIFTLFKVSANKNPGEGIGTKIKSNTWMFILANVIIIGSCNCMMANVAQVVGGAALGLPLPAHVMGLGPQNIGNVMNVFSMAMLISGFIFKPVWANIFKRHAYTVGILMCGLGLLVCYYGVTVLGSLPIACVGSALFGFGFQTYNGAIILRIAQSNDNKHVAVSTSFLMAFNGVGQTFGPIWIPGLIMMVMGLAFSDAQIFSLSWLFAGIILIVMTVIMGIYTQLEKVYRPEAAF